MDKTKLNYLFLCDEANFSQEGKLNVLGIFDQITLKNLPGGLARAKLVCNLTIQDPKTELVIDIVNMSTQEIAVKIDGLQIPTTNKKSDKIGIMIDLTNIQFTTEGTYSLRLLANGEVIGESSLQVKKNVIAG